MRKLVVQRHHVRYEDHPQGELVVDVKKGEHTILSRIQNMSQPSPGFCRALLELLPSIWDRMLVPGEKPGNDHPRTRILVDSGHRK